MSALSTLRGLGWLLPATLLTLSAIALTGCVDRLSGDGEPGVPQGFGERVPDVPLGGYIFVKPPGDDSTINIRADLRQRDGSTIPWHAEARSISLWLSPADTDQQAITTTIRFTFANEVDAISAHNVLSGVDAGMPTWANRSGRDAEVVLGDQAQVWSMRNTLNGNHFITDEQLTRTGMWRNALNLPQAPPKPVLAAGFTQVPPERMNEILEWLAEQGIVDLTQFGEMLETLRLDGAVFAVYGDSLPELSVNTVPEELASHGLTGLAIARTGVPAPLVSWGFNVGALRAGLDRVESRTGRYYRYEGDGAVVLAQVRQGDIQVAASSSPEDAAQILELIPN